jgi:hypothetical protein
MRRSGRSAPLLNILALPSLGTTACSGADSGKPVHSGAKPGVLMGVEGQDAIHLRAGGDR